MSAAVAPVLPGETLGDGKYRVERILGQGGMGIVVAAKHLALDERVAIKFLLGDPGPAAVERFLREARAAVKVKGEHVCRVLDFGRLESGEPYIVMEYLEGTDLAKLVATSGPQRPSAAVGFIVEACDALAEAHALGIVHRDIKPANIFLAKRGDETSVAKVLDFGISKLPSHTQGMTGTQTTMGSPAYMSPEQMESARDVDARSDVWSLGVTLYELLMGKPPFLADSMVQLTVLVREKEPAPLVGIPDALAQVVLKCLAKERKDRYQSVSALVGALSPFAPEEVIGIVRRLAKRDSVTSGDPAFAVTAPQGAASERSNERRQPSSDPGKHELAASRSEKTSEKGVGKGTFAPLQSTLDETGEASGARRRSFATLLVGVAIVGGLTAAAVVVTRSSGGASQAPRTAPEVAVSSIREDPSTPVASSAPVPALPPALSSVAARARPSATTPSPASALPAVRPPVLPSMNVATSAAASVAVVPVVSATSAASPPKPEPKKRRDLDRDDP